MKKILLGLATVGIFSALSFSACGSDPCPSSPKCSADPVPTADAIAACKTAAAVTTCKTERDAYSSCASGQQVCGTDNKTDGTRTLANIAANCKTQLDAYTKCSTPSVDAGTSRDGG